MVPREGGGPGETDWYWRCCKDQVEQGLFATRWPEGDETCPEKIKVESASKGRLEDKRCMERRFTSYDNVDYIVIYTWLMVSRYPVKRIVLKAQQDANLQINQEENQPKNHFS
jgi:hypothetical protein